MLKMIEKDILDIKSGVIVHQVNCMGRMGSGVAGQLKAKYPIVYDDYVDMCRHSRSSDELLGCYSIVPVNDILVVVNAFTQLCYGYDGRTYTSYGAIKMVFNSLIKSLEDVGINPTNIYIPYKYGCGLGGGDWNEVQKIISKTCPSVTVCKRACDD